MQRINVLSIQRISVEDRAKIEAVDPAIELTDAGGWYDGEIRETWPAFTSARYLAPGATGSGTPEERDRLLAEAEVILGGWPFPLDLRARAPRLKWFHQRPAGASNLLMGDLWGSRVVVTTSRGLGNNLAMAEYALAGILHFAKGFHRAAVDREAGVFDHRAYRPLLLEGKIACVVGAGGIGLDVGRLCAALGMRVVGTRRHPHPDRPLPPGFSELGGAYLAIVGGTAALETTWIEKIEDVDLDDLNPESLWKFRIRDFGPLLVAMDSHGSSLYSVVTEDAQARRAQVLADLGVKS